ncbi:hypothetical protein MAR_035763 [Mya arenaria]|uniref:Uncharacterized protein n=1 Tax=Mya arenaria TaxID=6604 RepID=A0ABY7EL28_MYAAR|nr:hypothetical protein MAR_035763 [Mya arenaria]
MSDRDLFTTDSEPDSDSSTERNTVAPHSNEVLQSFGSETQPPSPDQGDQPPYSGSETQPPSPDLDETQGDEPQYSGSETQLTPLELASLDPRTVSSDVSLDSPSITEHKKTERLFLFFVKKSKQNKRKLDRLQKKFGEKKAKLELVEVENKQLKQDIKASNKQTKLTRYKLARELVKNAQYKQSAMKMKNIELQLKEINKEAESELDVLREMLTVQEDIVLAAEENKNQLDDANRANDYLHGLLNDTKNIELYDENQNKYNNETAMCVMNLTDMKVPVERVGPVIKEVAKLCGKTVDRTPSAATVNRIVDRLREMVDKSGQSKLDTFKDILLDIKTYCHEADNVKYIGHIILCNIRDTMSDRASTEKHFNVLLEQFRNEILPEVIDNWEILSEQEKKLCSKMNNLYCGLHLLVGMADTCENGNDVGSGKKPELERYHRSESGTLRLLRTSSKSFAVGQDEKNGVSLPWSTYLKSRNEKNTIIRFKHNRIEGKAIRDKFKVRLKEIEIKRLEIKDTRRRKLQETERKRLQGMEKMTNAVCFYGLWKSEAQVNEALQRLSNDNEKRSALKSQLRFRKTVLKQKHEDSKVFNFTRKGTDGKYNALHNVLTLIQDCLHGATAEKVEEGVPLLVGKKIKHKFSDGKEYKGFVISVVPSFGEWYNVKYDNDDAIYAYNLCQDYKQGISVLARRTSIHLSSILRSCLVQYKIWDSCYAVVGWLVSMVTPLTYSKAYSKDFHPVNASKFVPQAI